MKHFAFMALVTCAALFSTTQPAHAITGPTSFALSLATGQPLCDGMIVGTWNGAIPAHCLSSVMVSNLRATVGVGTPAQQTLQVSQYSLHPNYDPMWGTYDMAVVRFSAELTLSEHVQIGTPSSSPQFSPFAEWIAGELYVATPPLVCP